MNFLDFLLQPLNLVTFFPLVGVLVILFINREHKNTIRWVALITSLITFGISMWVLVLFKPADPDLQLVINIPWIVVAGWEISFFMGIDGLSILLVLLTTLLTPISILSTWTAVEERVKEFMVFFLKFKPRTINTVSDNMNLAPVNPPTNETFFK